MIGDKARSPGEILPYFRAGESAPRQDTREMAARFRMLASTTRTP